MTDEQRQKLRGINGKVSTCFSEFDALDAKIRKHKQIVEAAQRRRAEVKAQLDAWEQKSADIWQEILNAQEVK